MIEENYNKLLKQFHKLSDRHILVVETDLSPSDAQKVVVLSDKIRKAGNELVSLMRKNYDQLIRTKKYRKLLKLYGSTEDKIKRKSLASQLNEMQKQYQVTWDFCRDWYSSFLLYCYDAKTKEIDKNKCKIEFERAYHKEKDLMNG